jgi:hypothetical protein
MSVQADVYVWTMENTWGAGSGFRVACEFLERSEVDALADLRHGNCPVTRLKFWLALDRTNERHGGISYPTKAGSDGQGSVSLLGSSLPVLP